MGGTLNFDSANRSNWDPSVDIFTSPMWPYCGKNLGIFKCPSDTSYVTVNGQNKPRVRTMVMNLYLGGFKGTGGGGSAELVVGRFRYPRRKYCKLKPDRCHDHRYERGPPQHVSVLIQRCYDQFCHEAAANRFDHSSRDGPATGNSAPRTDGYKTDDPSDRAGQKCHGKSSLRTSVASDRRGGNKVRRNDEKRRSGEYDCRS